MNNRPYVAGSADEGVNHIGRLNVKGRLDPFMRVCGTAAGIQKRLSAESQQPQPVSYQENGACPRLRPTQLKIPNGPRTHGGQLRERLLGQTRAPPMSAEQLPEVRRSDTM